MAKPVPGTEILYDVGNSEYIHTLQHISDKKGEGQILLVPQPSLTDSTDPLRWSKLKKWITLFNAVWYSFNGAVTGPIMAAGMIGLSEKFHTSLQRITYANGATLICQGVATTIWM
jgi:glutamate-1-semialdehyde aminotransferase